MKKLKFLPALLLVVLTGVFLLQRSFAATGQIYISPATSNNIKNGDTFSVALRINPATTTDTVDASVTYDQSKLTFVSIDDTSSAYGIPLVASGTGGTVHVTRGASFGTTVSSDSLIANITFTSKAGSGSTTLTVGGNAAYTGQATNPSFANGVVNFTTPPPPDTTPPVVSITSPTGGTVSSPVTVNVSASDASNIQKVELYKDDVLVTTDSIAPYSFSVEVGSGPHILKATAYDNSSNHNAKSASVTVTGPSTPITPPPTGNGGGGGSSGGGTSTSKPGTTVKGGTTNVPAPQQVGTVTVKAHSIQFTLASFDLTSDKPFSAYIEYGLNSSLGFTTPTTSSGTSHLIALDSSLLVPGTNFSYRVTTIDAAGKKTQSDIQTFKTQGFTVKITILDSAHKALRKKDVTLHSEPIAAQTDSQGVATFNDVAPGMHDVKYGKGKTYSKQIQVQNNVVTEGDSQTAPVQNISLVYDDLKQANNTWLWVVVGIVIFLVLAWAVTQYRQHSGPFRGGGDGGTLHGQVTVSGESSPAVTSSGAASNKLSKLFKRGSGPKAPKGGDDNIWTDQATGSTTSPTVEPPKDNDQTT